MSSHRQRKVVIYARYSSEMQREESCEDQEREVRDGLTRRGIDHRNAVILADKIISGEVADRAQFQLLCNMIEQGEVAVLAVDNRSRLTRAGASDAYSIVKDIVFHQGRFVATTEGIDTNEDSWEVLVQMKGITHSAENRDKANAVRRGQKGRAEKPTAAVGDHTYGFSTECDDRNWSYSKENPRPRKHNVKNEEEARWVEKIFHWFGVHLWSISKITKRLNELGVPKGHRSCKPGWHHHNVRRLLSNPKYVGRWLWGKTTTVRNSKGKKKQVPVKAPGTQPWFHGEVGAQERTSGDAGPPLVEAEDLKTVTTPPRIFKGITTYHYTLMSDLLRGAAGTPLKWNDAKEFGEMKARAAAPNSPEYCKYFYSVKTQENYRPHYSNALRSHRSIVQKLIEAGIAPWLVSDRGTAPKTRLVDGKKVVIARAFWMRNSTAAAVWIYRLEDLTDQEKIANLAGMAPPADGAKYELTWINPWDATPAMTGTEILPAIDPGDGKPWIGAVNFWTNKMGAVKPTGFDESDEEDVFVIIKKGK